MNFNGKTLIIIGSILFVFQLGNFFSVDAISPAFERAQVLSAISSVIIVLIGFLFEQLLSSSSIDIFYLEKYHHVARGIIVAATNKPITIYVAVELSASWALIVLKLGCTTGLSIEDGWLFS